MPGGNVLNKYVIKVTICWLIYDFIICKLRQMSNLQSVYSIATIALDTRCLRVWLRVYSPAWHFNALLLFWVSIPIGRRGKKQQQRNKCNTRAPLDGDSQKNKQRKAKKTSTTLQTKIKFIEFSHSDKVRGGTARERWQIRLIEYFFLFSVSVSVFWARAK